jgi:hypothetical protein
VSGQQHRGDVRPPEVTADEKATLLVFLDYLRDAVAAKLAGVSEQDARRRLVPSGTSLLWLVKHLTAVECAWFLYAFAGEPAAPLDESVSEADTIDGVLTGYRSMVRRCTTRSRRSSIWAGRGYGRRARRHRRTCGGY